MNTEFRTRLRVKAWKLPAQSQAELQAFQQRLDYQRLDKCPRCGIDRNGCRPSPCPHGNWCGIKPEPPFADRNIQGPIFISRFRTVQSGHSTWPEKIKTEIWN